MTLKKQNRTKTTRKQTSDNAIFSMWVVLGVLLAIVAYPLAGYFVFPDVSLSPYVYERYDFNSLSDIDAMLSADILTLAQNQDVRVIVIEFGDFTCAFCKEAQSTVAKLESDPRIAVGFAHFPGSQNPNSYAAATAYECLTDAGVVEAKRILYGVDVFSQAVFVELAQQLQVNVTCPQAQSAIAQDVEFGNMLRVQGTPTFLFIPISEPAMYEVITGANEPAMDAFLRRWLVD